MLSLYSTKHRYDIQYILNSLSSVVKVFNYNESFCKSAELIQGTEWTDTIIVEGLHSLCNLFTVIFHAAKKNNLKLIMYSLS